MSLETFATSLQATSLSTALKTITWIIPALQSIHILMIGVVFVAILVVSLRVLGRMRTDESLVTVWRRFAPFFWTALVLMAITGAVLTVAEPVREFMTLSFRLKMVLLVVGIGSALLFGRRMRREAAVSVGSASASRGARMAAILTLVLWIAVIFLGRAIAYDTSVWGKWSPVKSVGGAAT